MANWISSKLKAAENILQQIDQQAADSLGKNEKPPIDGLSFDSPGKSESSVSLKDQLKKKPQESNSVYHGRIDQSLNAVNSSAGNSKNESFSLHKEGFLSPKQPSPKPKATLTDGDWTQLLSTRSPPAASIAGAVSRGNGLSGIRGLRKDRKSQANIGSGSSVEGRRIQTGNNGKVAGKIRGVEGNKVNGKTGDGDELGVLDSAARSSGVKIQSDFKHAKGREFDNKEAGESCSAKQVDKGNVRNDGPSDSVDLSLKASLQSFNGNATGKVVPVLGNIDVVSETKMQVVDTCDRLRSTLNKKHETSNAASRSSTSDDLKRVSSSVSYGSTDSDSESGSSSESEVEREREERRQRREKILAEKAAAKAVEAIKEKENSVARLEGEKQSLEKIFDEQTKQQAQEASKLQTSMMETMEAVDLEKQKHNNTRMEVLALLAKLETANADLARSLAAMQWNLEVEVNRVAELRQQIDLKEVKNEELRRSISNAHQTGTSSMKITALIGGEIEQEILEAEYALNTDKVRKLQDKSKKLEADIEMMRKEMEEPTEVEVELKRRLNQMTDHLIQKQAQVESLSSEKATIQFRIEAVSRMLDENKSLADYAGTSFRDLESGTWDLSHSKLKPLIKDKIRSSQKHLYSLLQQFDSIFLAGAVFLRNPTAKLWSLVYLVCLHLWVIYIFMSHSQPSNESASGAVFSLENINNT